MSVLFNQVNEGLSRSSGAFLSMDRDFTVMQTVKPLTAIPTGFLYRTFWEIRDLASNNYVGLYQTGATTPVSGALELWTINGLSEAWVDVTVSPQFDLFYTLAATYEARSKTFEFFINGASRGTFINDLSGCVMEHENVGGEAPWSNLQCLSLRQWQRRLTQPQIVAEMARSTPLVTLDLFANFPLVSDAVDTVAGVTLTPALTPTYDGLAPVYATPATAQTMIAGPSQLLSLGKSVTISGASAVTNYDDLTVLTDGFVKDVVKLDAAGTFIIDLGANVTPNLVALANHNFTSIRLRFSTSIALTSPVIDHTFYGAKRVAMLDLRGFTFSAARYMAVTPGNSDPLLGEFLVADAVLFDGPITEMTGPTYSPQIVKTSGYGSVEVVRSGVLHRSLDVGFVFASDIDTFLGIMEECGLTGSNFLFVPESLRQEAFWVEWVESYEYGLTNALVTPFRSMSFIEEAFSVF